MDMAAAAAAGSGLLTRHGFPPGYRFYPEPDELVQLLVYRLRGQPLPLHVDEYFHDIRVLDRHPQQLYEEYRAHQETGSIYFFSRQELPRSASGRRVRAPPDDDNDGKKWRPGRSACGGTWKPSGGGRLVRNRSGRVVGKMVTMVFYERGCPGAVGTKTNWGLNEFTALLSGSPPDKAKYSKLAVYRLYKVKKPQQANDDDDHHVPAGQQQANVVAVSHHYVLPSTSAAAGTSATCRALVAGSSSSTTSQEQKPQLISIEQIQQHYNHYAFAATATPVQCIWAPQPPATNSQDDTKPVPVAGAPAGYFQFVAPSDQGTTVPPAALNLGIQKSAAATAAMQYAGSVDHFGATSSALATPAAASTAAEQRAPAMSPPHAQFAGRDETTEEDPSRQLLEDDDRMLTSWNDLGDIHDMYDDYCLPDGWDIEFSMEEIMGTDHNTSSSGDGNNLAG